MPLFFLLLFIKTVVLSRWHNGFQHHAGGVDISRPKLKLILKEVGGGKKKNMTSEKTEEATEKPARCGTRKPQRKVSQNKRYEADKAETEYIMGEREKEVSVGPQ